MTIETQLAHLLIGALVGGTVMHYAWKTRWRERNERDRRAQLRYEGGNR